MNDQDQTVRTIGRWMLVFAWIGGLLLLISVFTPWVQQRENPNQNPPTTVADHYREVILRAGRHGHYIATGKINGVPVTFLVDTGASHVAVPHNIANKLGLQPGTRYQVSTAAGTVSVFATRLDQISLGDIELKQVEASINPNRQGEEILLGMSFLRELEIIHRGDELTLRQYF